MPIVWFLGGRVSVIWLGLSLVLMGICDAGVCVCGCPQAHLIRNVYEKAEGGRKRDAAYPVRMTLFGLSAGVYWVKVPEALSECQRDKPTIYLSAVRTSNAVSCVEFLRVQFCYGPDAEISP